MSDSTFVFRLVLDWVLFWPYFGFLLWTIISKKNTYEHSEDHLPVNAAFSTDKSASIWCQWINSRNHDNKTGKSDIHWWISIGHYCLTNTKPTKILQPRQNDKYDEVILMFKFWKGFSFYVSCLDGGITGVLCAAYLHYRI